MRHRAVLGPIVAAFSFFLGCGGGPTSSPLPPPPAPDFKLQIQPINLGLVLGNSSQIQVTESALNGFTGTVSVSASPLPAGVTISPTLPQNIGPSGLTLSVGSVSSAPTGTYNLSLTGTSGSLQHSTNLVLSLGNRANISISAPTQTVNVVQGGNMSVPININTDNGIADFNIQIQAFAPSGITATFSSTVVPPNTGASLSLAAAPSATMVREA